jgi:hypothetical protein
MRLQINFDPSAPLFTVEASENPTILNSRLLRQISNIDAGKISDFEQKIDEEGIYP